MIASWKVTYYEEVRSVNENLRRWERAPAAMREQGDVLALYADGVTEAANDRGEEFGERLLIEALRQHQELSCQALLAAIMDGVRRFGSQEQHDDITAIVAKFKDGE
jgi:serine phosphatase RsbU (regulator of sigma subunit)